MTVIRESCPCGARIRVEHPDPAPIAAEWRGSHLCDRRSGGERDITAGATAEVAYTEPHPTDSQVRQPIGFTPPPHPDIRDLIERSSLGTPEAVAARARAPEHLVQDVMRRLRLAERADQGGRA